MSFDSVSAFFASRSAARCATMVGLPKPAKGLSVSGTTIVDAVWPPLATCRPPDGFGVDLAPFLAPNEKAAAPAARYKMFFISTNACAARRWVARWRDAFLGRTSWMPPGRGAGSREAAAGAAGAHAGRTASVLSCIRMG